MSDFEDRPKRLPSQPSKLRLSYACARLILQWHQEVGINLARGRVSSEYLDRYLNTVYQYGEVDLRWAGHQRSLASEQISSIFEWFYGEKVPEEIWRLHTRRLQIDIEPPQTLGEVGSLILSLLEGIDDSEYISEEEQEGRLLVRAITNEQLLDQARDFYSDLTEDEDKDIGGVNVLLSSSLERTHTRELIRENIKYEVVLLRPEILGFRQVRADELKEGLLNKVRSGELIIDKIEGGPSSDWNIDGEEKYDVI